MRNNMNFQSINPLNVQLNVFSGNLFPMSDENSSFPLFWRVHSLFVFVVQLIHIITLIFGAIFAPLKRFLEDGIIYIAITLEVFFIAIRIYACRKLTQQLIGKLNDIMRINDATMWNIIRVTVKPIETVFRCYWIVGTISVIFWCCTSFRLISEKSEFYYTDYRMPVVYANEPFSTGVFILGNIILLLSNIYIFFRKVSMDMYITHLVLLIMVQHRFIAVKLVTILQNRCVPNEHEDSHEKQWIKIESCSENEIKKLCRHQDDVIRITFMLKKLLSFNFSLIYLSTVFRFCCLAILLFTKMSSASLSEKTALLLYISFAITQFYVMCSSVQELLDASAEITDKAFHENWYCFGPSLKRTFMLMMMSNFIEFKLSAFQRFNISLSSFMSVGLLITLYIVLNQSYSIALLFKRFGL